MRLGDLLVQSGYVTQEQLQAALVEQRKFGGRLGDILAQLGFCSEEAVARALAKQLGCAFVDLKRAPVPPSHVLARLPYELAVKWNVAPCLFRDKDQTLVVAVANARDKEIEEKLTTQTRWKIMIALAGPAAIRQARARMYRRKDEMELEKDDNVPMMDLQGRTLVKRADDVEREHAAAVAARTTSSPGIPAAPRTISSPALPQQTRTASSASMPQVAAPAPAPVPGYPVDQPLKVIRGFTDEKGRTDIRSIADIMREARERGEVTDEVAPSVTPAGATPTTAELLATVEALRSEVAALKAVAIVLFRKGYVTSAEYQAQLQGPPG